MATPEITLTGSAVTGIAPQLVPANVMAALPQKVKLGRIRRKAHPPVPRLDAYFDPKKATTPPPASTNWREKAAASIARMYLNDAYGDCVPAGKFHALGVWSANDPDSGPVVLATDSEVLNQYHAICGPGDNGCVITDVLDVWRSKGLTAGGKVYKLDGYVSVDWRNKLLVQVVQAIFAASSIGINLPGAWTSNAVWDVTNTGIVGGHDVTPIDYDDKGVYVASWGRIYLITWAAFMSTKWLDEMYALLSPQWYGPDKMAPNGIDAATLLVDLQKLGSGVIPDIGPGPGPVGPPPPPPPPPPAPEPLLTLEFGRTIRKNARVSFRAPVEIPAGSYDVVPQTGAAPKPLNCPTVRATGDKVKDVDEEDDDD